MKRITKMQTKDLVAETIRDQILSGDMEAGEELTQELLAEMLGVSRMPVREALQMLEQEGYIERLPNRHMVVADLGEAKLNGIMNLIAAMETEIIRQGCAIRVDEIKYNSMAVDTGKPDMDKPERLLVSMEQALAHNNSELAAEYELEYHYALACLLDITYIEQLFNKAIGGYVSYLIQKQTQELAERFRVLAQLEQQRQAGDTDEIRTVIQNYYQILFDSWNRKESIES